jgi:hypothetical protein
MVGKRDIVVKRYMVSKLVSPGNEVMHGGVKHLMRRAGEIRDSKAWHCNSTIGRQSIDGRRGLWKLCDETGSVSPLILTYFLITLIVIFIGINTTHAYLERRHLILAMESSLQRATQQIDRWRYYNESVEANTSRFGSRGVTTFVPIDCIAARTVFDEEFSIQWALTRALNRPDVNLEGRALMQSNLWNSDGMTIGVANEMSVPHSSPKVTVFRCDGKTIAASAELIVELPFALSFSGVELLKFSRQTASVEVGLVFGG